MVSGGGVKRRLLRARAPILFVLLLVGGFSLLRHDLADSHSPKRAAAFAKANTAFGHLPIAFEPNQGQTDARARFVAHGMGYGLFLTETEALLSFPGDRDSRGPVLEMRLAGANSNAGISGLNQLPGHSNYFIGNVASRWHRNIPQFSRVRYHAVYPGIDLDFYGNEGRLEYDFNVMPGADFRRIELDFAGAQNASVAANGDLVLNLNGRELRFEPPRAYQESASGRQAVAGKFASRGDNRIGFEVGAYDRSRTLIIDPVLTFSTYLGGTGDESCAKITGATTGFVANCPAITVDASQNVYVAGATTDISTFPIPAGGAANKIAPLGGASDVYIANINSSGTALSFTTFIGGSGLDYPTGIALVNGFNVCIIGNTNSSDFPTTPTAFQATNTTPGTATFHAFVSELDSSGSVNTYSSYLEGNGSDLASSLAVDSQGFAYIFGTTSSSDFPVTATALQGTALATNQFFLSKINLNSSTGPGSLLYSTYIGGSTPTNGIVTGGGIALDANTPPNVYIAGGTNFIDMPVLDAAEGTEEGGLDVWVAKLNAPGNTTQQYVPAFETYFGGSGDDIAYGVATDGTNTYVTGSTTSSNITIPAGVLPLQATLTGGSDAFLAKFSVPTTVGTTQGAVPVAYFTYLGGSGNDVGLSVAADTGTSIGNARVTGFTTSSSSWPETVKNNIGPLGSTDAFMARVLTTVASTTTTTTTTTSSNTSTVTFIGGAGVDRGTSIAEDVNLNTYVAGETFSSNFPATAPPGSTPLQSSLAGTSDSFVSKLGPNVAGLLSFTCIASAPVSGLGCPSPVPSNPSVNPSPVGVGSPVTFTYDIYNQGDPVTGVVFTSNVQGTNSKITSATVGGGSTGNCTLNSGGTSAVCNLGTLNSSTVTTTTSGTTTVTTTATAGQVTVTVVPNVPAQGSPQPFGIGNRGQLSLPGTGFANVDSLPGSATVNDFAVTATPSPAGSNVVTAGATATYQVTVTPTGPIPESVSLSVTGLPSGSTSAFSNGSASIPNLNNGPHTSTLEITTTVRVTTPASLFGRGGPIYAIWLPLTGVALVGSGFSRKRRVLLMIMFALLLSAVTLQSACSTSSSIASTTGTPAGTYNLTINAVSGGSGSAGSSATRSTVVQLVVK